MVLMFQCLTEQPYTSQDIRDGVSMRYVLISPISAIPGHIHSAAEIRPRFHTWPRKTTLSRPLSPQLHFLTFKGSKVVIPGV